jgi:hypothetical protein
MPLDAQAETTPEADVPSIRDALTAAMGENTDAPAAASPEPAAAPPEAPAAGGPARDPDGKFAKAPEQAQAPTPEPNAPQAGAEPATPAIRPPASWSATAKADFAKLPEHIQKEVLKRESDIEGGLAQQATKAERLNRLDGVLAPRQERFRLAGIDEVQAVQTLFAAQDMLESPDPNIRASAIQYLARQSGVDLRTLAGAPAAQQPQQAQQPPELQTLMREVANLKQTLGQQQTAAHQQSLSETQTQIASFAADPANVYFANVREDMGRLIAAGQAASLKDAYDKACWGNEEIRGLLLREKQTAAVAEQERLQRERAQAARRASGSITGSPGPGSSQATGPTPSIREALTAAYDASV